MRWSSVPSARCRDEECAVQRSSTCIIKPGFDLARRSALRHRWNEAGWGREQVHTAPEDVYTNPYQPQPRSHELFTNRDHGLSVAALLQNMTKNMWCNWFEHIMNKSGQSEKSVGGLVSLLLSGDNFKVLQSVIPCLWFNTYLKDTDKCKTTHLLRTDCLFFKWENQWANNLFS